MPLILVLALFGVGAVALAAATSGRRRPLRVIPGRVVRVELGGKRQPLKGHALRDPLLMVAMRRWVATLGQGRPGNERGLQSAADSAKAANDAAWMRRILYRAVARGWEPAPKSEAIDPVGDPARARRLREIAQAVEGSIVVARSAGELYFFARLLASFPGKCARINGFYPKSAPSGHAADEDQFVLDVDPLLHPLGEDRDTDWERGKRWSCNKAIEERRRATSARKEDPAALERLIREWLKTRPTGLRWATRPIVPQHLPKPKPITVH